MGHDILPAPKGLAAPFEYAGETVEEYSEKATLSPWVPVPESVARKIFDHAPPTAEDVHVELGSGDGRVNFYAIEAGAGKSVGIDVDENIVKVATDRLERIHPKPNLEFIVADLVDSKHPAWKHIEEATILTMYFAKEGLEMIRPRLENALRGKKCKIFCCGYPMPTWDSQLVETVLDLPIHFYDWGNAEIENSMFAESMVDDLNMEKMEEELKNSIVRRKKNSKFKPDPLPGYDPDDLIDYGWDDFDDEPEEEEDDSKDAKK